MLILFVSLFFASVMFLIFFLMNLQEDIKRESIIPLFKIVCALGFWIFCLPALLAPELSTTITTGSQVTTIAASGLPIRTYNAFFIIWLAIIVIQGFLVLVWYITMLRAKTARLLKEGASPLEGLEKTWSE